MKALIKRLLARWTSRPYVSDVDGFLASRYRQQTRTPSQQAEIDKHRRIHHLRDHRRPQPNVNPTTSV